MSERRPHWDDDLIEAVADVLEHDDLIYATTYAVIAAVEDWQDANGLGRIGQLLGQRQSAINERIEAEATIQRVRGMADAAIAAHGELEGTYATVSAKAILRALGDSDD